MLRAFLILLLAIPVFAADKAGHRVEALAAYSRAIELSDTPRALPILTQAIRELSDLTPKK
jgi:hypothetical protein